MPYLGVAGGVASNPQRPSAPSVVMLDAIAAFGSAPNDAIYLANDGGWLRSTKNNPGPCTAAGVCPDWTVVTPTAAAFTAKLPVTTSKTSNFEPADKAVPAMVEFVGTLFAARNTTTGPQLWSCRPVAPNTQCNASDWSLVAPNTLLPALDTQLTQMQNSNNIRISLLAVAGSYLYVGFNNTSQGVALYRTANPAATSVSHFEGDNTTCAAGALLSAPCPGIGGYGLGAGVQLIFDGRALTFAGATYLYLTASSGGAVSIFRVAP
jgi:hypothetical protein